MISTSLRRSHRLTPTKQMPVQNKIRWTTIRITLLHENFIIFSSQLRHNCMIITPALLGCREHKAFRIARAKYIVMKRHEAASFSL